MRHHRGSSLRFSELRGRGQSARDAERQLFEKCLPPELIKKYGEGRIGCGTPEGDYATMHLHYCPKCQEEVALLQRAKVQEAFKKVTD